MRREEENRKEEDKLRRKEEEKAKRDAILEQHKLKKEMERMAEQVFYLHQLCSQRLKMDILFTPPVTVMKEQDGWYLLPALSFL